MSLAQQLRELMGKAPATAPPTPGTFAYDQLHAGFVKADAELYAFLRIHAEAILAALERQLACRRMY